MDILIDRELIEEILEFARFKHPNEAIVLLRGDIQKDSIKITDYLFPPYAFSNKNSAGFPTHMIPFDFRIIGTAHSHPTGSNTPSVVDLHNFYGRLMVLLGYPYNINNVAAYTKNGEKINIKIVE